MDREQLTGKCEEFLTLHAGSSAAAVELTVEEPEPELRLNESEPGAQSRWIKPLSCYERRETTIVEGLRYG